MSRRGAVGGKQLLSVDLPAGPVWFVQVGADSRVLAGLGETWRDYRAASFRRGTSQVLMPSGNG